MMDTKFLLDQVDIPIPAALMDVKVSAECDSAYSHSELCDEVKSLLNTANIWSTAKHTRCTAIILDAVEAAIAAGNYDKVNVICQLIDFTKHHVTTAIGLPKSTERCKDLLPAWNNMKERSVSHLTHIGILPFKVLQQTREKS